MPYLTKSHATGMLNFSPNPTQMPQSAYEAQKPQVNIKKGEVKKAPFFQFEILKYDCFENK